MEDEIIVMQIIGEDGVVEEVIYPFCGPQNSIGNCVCFGHKSGESIAGWCVQCINDVVKGGK